MGCGTSRLEDRYYLQKVKLGQGSFGTVWRGVDKQDHTVVAIKQLDKALMPRRKVNREDVAREIEIMEFCQHNNILRLLNTYEDTNSMYLALEYCDGGDFGDKLKERAADLQENEAAGWMRDVCAAIHALHTRLICHCDVKPENFMVSGITQTLKLADFGLAVFLPAGKALVERCGTPSFMSPEQHRLPASGGFGFPADMWAAGVIFYMLMSSAKHPFLREGQGSGLDHTKLLEGRLDFDSDGMLGNIFRISRFSERAKTLCRKMVEPNPVTRQTAAEALACPFLASVAERWGQSPTVQLGHNSLASVGNGSVRQNNFGNSSLGKTPRSFGGAWSNVDTTASADEGKQLPHLLNSAKNAVDGIPTPMQRRNGISRCGLR